MTCDHLTIAMIPRALTEVFVKYTILFIMNQPGSVSLTFQQSTIEELLDLLSQREKSARKLRKQLLLSLPDSFLKKGSDLWWEKEVVLGEKEIRAGRYKTYKSAKGFIDDLRKGI